jgi:hypothetical protein
MLNVIDFLLLSVVPDVAGTANNLTEEKISDKCFELMFAFDEVSQFGIVSLSIECCCALESSSVSLKDPFRWNVI